MRNSLKFISLATIVYIGMSCTVMGQTVSVTKKFDPWALFKASVSLSGVVVSQRSHSFLGGQCIQSRGEDNFLPDLFVFATSSSQYPNISEINNCIDILDDLEFSSVTIPTNGTQPDSVKEARMRDLSCTIIEVNNFPKIFSVYFSDRYANNMSKEITSCFKKAEVSENQVRIKWEKVAQ